MKWKNSSWLHQQSEMQCVLTSQWFNSVYSFVPKLLSFDNLLAPSLPLATICDHNIQYRHVIYHLKAQCVKYYSTVFCHLWFHHAPLRLSFLPQFSFLPHCSVLLSSTPSLFFSHMESIIFSLVRGEERGGEAVKSCMVVTVWIDHKWTTLNPQNEQLDLLRLARVSTSVWLSFYTDKEIPFTRFTVLIFKGFYR